MVTKCGSVKLNENIQLSRVLCALEFACNLISILQLTREYGYHVTYMTDYYFIQD